MKDFFIGLFIGIFIGGTGAYKFVRDKIENVTTKENAEKVVKAAQDFGKDIAEIAE